jgi:Amt family ammonium transporter
MRRRSALSMLSVSLLAIAVVSVQWFLWGYSLVFSHKAGRFIGALDKFAFQNVLASGSVVSPAIPDLLAALYYNMFACFT